MPPLCPWQANANRAHPQHRSELSHTTAVTPCPIHVAPPTHPMPFTPRCLWKSMQMYLLPIQWVFSLHTWPCPSLPQLVANMLPWKNVSIGNIAAHLEGLPMPPTRPSKDMLMFLSPWNECHSHTLGPILARQGALKPSRKHVALEKCASKQCHSSPRGLTHASHPTLPIKRHVHVPPPHTTSVFPTHSTPSQLVDESPSGHVASKKHANEQMLG